MPNYIKTKLADITKKSDNITELEFLLEVLPPLSENGPWIAGGSLLRTYLNLRLTTDIDIFFKDKSQYDDYNIKLDAISKKYGESPNNNLFRIDSRESVDWHRTYSIVFRNKNYKLQLIHKKFFTGVCNLLDSFDLNICQIGFDGTHLFHAENCITEIDNREIKIETVNLPQVALKRLIKYSSLGFKISDTEIHSFFYKCSKLPNFNSLVDPKNLTTIQKSSYEGIE